MKRSILIYFHLPARLKGIKRNLFMLALVTCLSCSEFLDIDSPATQLVRATVFENDVTATAAMSGIYRQMTSGITGGSLGSITFLTTLSSDETNWFSGAGQNAAQLCENNVLPTNPLITSFWSESYALIYQANAVIEGLEVSDKLSPDVKATLEGEARFVRAFYHFYLLNLFGDVPEVESTDYRANAMVSRMNATDLYEMIIDDLTRAHELLKEDYSFSSGERVRPARWTAAALLARVQLYRGNWEEARSYATAVISNTALYELAGDLTTVFLKNSREAIFQLLPPAGANYTNEANIFLRTPTYSSLRSELVDAFDPADLRFGNWIASITSGTDTYYYPVKYKEMPGNATGAEYSMVLRLAEQYLIRAEANAQLGNLSLAVEDVDLIRARAGLSLLADTNPGIAQTELLEEILQQRRLELFTEWGHRWFDLKRRGRATEVIGKIKATWEETDQLFPLPEKELIANPNLLPQNPGY